jgi:GDP-L-fucose synthase
MKYLNDFLITGGSGMVGKSFLNKLPNAIYVSSKQYDLRDPVQTNNMFEEYRPRFVIHLAARVGGVLANMNNLGSFYYDNVMINTNVLESARVFETEKLLSCLSTCIYPDQVTYPLTEDQIHNGAPHQSNFSYAYTKRMIEIQSKAYKEQYGCNFISMAPNNLFGQFDNFSLKGSHVIPAMIRKIYEAKLNNTRAEFWGDGTPLREFTYSKDIPDVSLFLLEKYNSPDVINVGNSHEVSIEYVVSKVQEYFDFDGEIFWDTTKPMGQFRKPSSNKKLLDLGWKADDYTSMEKGLKETCEWFIMNYPNIRGMDG